MPKIKLYNNIAQIGLDQFTPDYEVNENMEDEDAILVRSANLHNIEYGNNLKAIARAGTGVNNIDIDTCTKKGIAVFNTPGANSNAVKELVLRVCYWQVVIFIMVLNGSKRKKKMRTSQRMWKNKRKNMLVMN